MVASGYDRRDDDDDIDNYQSSSAVKSTADEGSSSTASAGGRRIRNAGGQQDGSERRRRQRQLQQQIPTAMDERQQLNYFGNIPPPPMQEEGRRQLSSMPYGPTYGSSAGHFYDTSSDPFPASSDRPPPPQQQMIQQQQPRPPFSRYGDANVGGTMMPPQAKRRKSITSTCSTFDDLDVACTVSSTSSAAARPKIGEIGFASSMAGVFLEDLRDTLLSSGDDVMEQQQQQQQQHFSRKERSVSLPSPQHFVGVAAASNFGGGEFQQHQHQQQQLHQRQSPSSARNIESGASSCTNQSVRRPVPPPFAFKYSCTRGGGDAANHQNHGVQRFKGGPSSSEMPQSSTTKSDNDADECIKIHTTSYGSTQAKDSVHDHEHAPSTSLDDTKGQQISAPQKDELPVRAPPIRFFNNGVEVSEDGVPIATPNQRPKEKRRQVENVISQRPDDNNKVLQLPKKNATDNSSPVPSLSGEDPSLSPPLSRSCNVADVISFAVRNVPELSKQVDASNKNSPTSIDIVLLALYRIAGEIKSKTSPKAGTSIDAKQTKDMQLYHTRVSNTIRSVEGYKRGLVAASINSRSIGVGNAKANQVESATNVQASLQDSHAHQADICASLRAAKEQPALKIIPEQAGKPQPNTKSSAGAATRDRREPSSNTSKESNIPAGPHSSLINQIFGGRESSSKLESDPSSSKSLGNNPEQIAQASGEDIVRDSFNARKKDLSAASALIGFKRTNSEQ